MTEAVPALVAEFRAMMSEDGQGIPSAEHCRAVILFVASKLPAGPAIYAMWHIENGADVARLCEFDGSKCYECALDPAELQSRANDLNAARYSESGRYIVAPMPAGVGVANEEVGEARAGGVSFPWVAGFDGGWTTVSANVSDLSVYEAR